MPLKKMLSYQFLYIGFAAATMAAAPLKCPPFPSSIVEFSSGFQQPKPPNVKPEYTAHFVQHKWNADLSHITVGYIENSPSKNFVRVDEAFDKQLASSYFDYSNVTKSGLVDNTLTTYNHQNTTPNVWRGYVNSNFPIFSKRILVDAGAVFEGLVERNFNPSPVAAWSLMYQGAIPVTVYVNECAVIVGYDYFAPELRTRVIMEFFNIEAK